MTSITKKSNTTGKAVLLGITGLGFLGGITYAAPTLVLGTVAGGLAGMSAGGVIGAITGIASAVSYYAVNNREAGARESDNPTRSFPYCPDRPATNASVLGNKIAKNCIILGAASGAIVGGYFSTPGLHSEAKTKVETEIEMSTQKKIGFNNQTLQEAVDEFRQKTNESVYIHSQQPKLSNIG